MKNGQSKDLTTQINLENNVENSTVVTVDVARAVAQSMLREPVFSVSRIPFGNVNFVFEITAASGSYVLRMTYPEWFKAYEDAIALQKILIPLGVPVARFIDCDINGRHSPYPAVLMHKLVGTDLVNVYPDLSIVEKLALADAVAAIHRLTDALPAGRGYGFAAAGEVAPYASWAEFLLDQWDACLRRVMEVGALSEELAQEAYATACAGFEAIGHIPPAPFIWDLADRNLMIDRGRLTGIVDVDNLCYGDPLYTVALASAVFDKEIWDATYVDQWLTHFREEEGAGGSVALRFACYRLFWLLNCLRSSGQLKGNGNLEPDRKERLTFLIREAIVTIKTALKSPFDPLASSLRILANLKIGRPWILNHVSARVTLDEFQEIVSAFDLLQASGDLVVLKKKRISSGENSMIEMVALERKK